MPFFILNDPTGPADPDCYSELTNLPVCGKPKQQICYIEAERDSTTGKPIINEKLLWELVTALGKRKNTENVKLKSR